MCEGKEEKNKQNQGFVSFESDLTIKGALVYKENNTWHPVNDLLMPISSTQVSRRRTVFPFVQGEEYGNTGISYSESFYRFDVNCLWIRVTHGTRFCIFMDWSAVALMTALKSRGKLKKNISIFTFSI